MDYFHIVLRLVRRKILFRVSTFETGDLLTFHERGNLQGSKK